MLRFALAAAAMTLSVLAVSGGDAEAASRCSQHYLAGTQPKVHNSRLLQSTAEICYTDFAVLHSGLTRTPLYAVERLTRQRISKARNLERVNEFHEEPSLPAAQRADLDDYVKSGFDRGHVAPSANMSSPQAQRESFSLANMVPHHPNNNRGIWADIESATRGMATRHGEVWVVSGPLFEGAKIAMLRRRVAIPTSMFKAVYIPSTGQAGVYLTPNKEGGEWQSISVAQLTQMAGFDVFPTLPASVKAGVMDLSVGSSPRRSTPGQTASQDEGLDVGTVARTGWSIIKGAGQLLAR